MNETLANIAIVAATTGTITFLMPQMVKLIRTRDSAGVSTTWAALGFVTNVGWFAFVISQELWAAILAPLVTFVSYAVTLWALNRTGRDLRKSLGLGSAWALLLALIALGAGWEALGVALGLSYGVMLSPSLWTAFRTRDPSGVSAGTWWIGLFEAMLWGYYGLFNGAAGMVTFGIVGVTGSILILGRYYSTRRLSEVPA